MRLRFFNLTAVRFIAGFIAVVVFSFFVMGIVGSISENAKIEAVVDTTSK